MKTEDGNAALTEEGNTEFNESSDVHDIIKAELDDQITDLLSSIRKAEDNGECDDKTAGNEVGGNTPADANTTTSNSDDNKATDVTVDNGQNVDNDETFVAENDDTANAENAGTENADAENTENANAENAGNANTDKTENNGLLTEKPGNGDVPIEKETPIKRDIPIEKETPIKGDVPIETETPTKRDAPIEKETPIKQEHKDVAEVNDTVQPLDVKAPPPAKSTPARASARLATPGRIQTRRASRMTQNDA